MLYLFVEAFLKSSEEDVALLLLRLETSI